MQSLLICMYETPERWNWRCVPSPQSKRMTSEPRLSATAGTFLSTLGHEAPVPRKQSSIDSCILTIQREAEHPLKRLVPRPREHGGNEGITEEVGGPRSREKVE